VANETINWGVIPPPIAEYKFHPTRKWRIDFAFPEIKLAIEIEGAVWSFGRHNHPSGFIKDIEKYNALTELGWHLLRYQPKKIDFNQIKIVYDNLVQLKDFNERYNKEQF
jgi:very-short-patch-repair endonuclease